MAYALLFYIFSSSFNAKRAITSASNNTTTSVKYNEVIVCFSFTTKLSICDCSKTPNF